MNYSFHPEAEEEFLAAIDCYEHREKDLGFDFTLQVHAAIAGPQSTRRLGPFSKDK